MFLPRATRAFVYSRAAPISGASFLRMSRSSVERCLSTTTAATEPFHDEEAPSAEDIAAIQQKLRENPNAAKAIFSSRSTLKEGLRSTATIRNKFHISADEPTAIGGTDTAANPVEILVAALGSCQEITFKAYAQAMNIPLLSVSSKLSGEIDLRGFFGVDPTVRPGFQKITGVVTVETPASVSTEQIKELKEIVDQHCPVKDMLQSVPMSVELKHKQA